MEDDVWARTAVARHRRTRLPAADATTRLDFDVILSSEALQPPAQFYDGLMVKFTSRVSDLFASLSVTLISRRYWPSGNDASGTACPVCSWCPAAMSNTGGSVPAFRFCGFVLLKNFSPALHGSPAFGSLPGIAWQKLYSTITSGLFAPSVFGL